MVAVADIGGSGRRAIYDALNRRNRLVGLLRIVVPGIGLLVLAVLGIQMAIASLGRDFQIGSISIERDRLRIETPSYAGRMDDGGSYEVSAAAAEASLSALNLIDLENALVVVNRPNGVQAAATAAAAQIETELQQVNVPGVTELSETTGITGQLTGMLFDFAAQTVSASGPVTLTFAGGQTLDAAGMTFETATGRWTFSKVTLVVPDLPGGPEE